MTFNFKSYSTAKLQEALANWNLILHVQGDFSSYELGEIIRDLELGNSKPIISMTRKELEQAIKDECEGSECSLEDFMTAEI